MVTKAYKMMMAAILDQFSIFEILSKIEILYEMDFYKKYRFMW